MSERNHEQDTIDAIDALVSESLSVGPGFDDYHRDWHDRSGDVRCSLCWHEWHGIANDYGCPGEFGTEDEIERWRSNVRVSGTFADLAGTVLDGSFDATSWFTTAPCIPPEMQFPRQFPVSYRAPRVRFWTTHPETGEMQMLEGTMQIDRFDYSPSGMTITALLQPPIQQFVIDARDAASIPPGNPEHECTLDRSGRCVWASCATNCPRPVQPLQEDRISLEALTVGDENIGFESIGTIRPDALNIEHSAEYEHRGGRTLRTAERYEATVAFDEGAVDMSFFNRLIRGGQ